MDASAVLRRAKAPHLRPNRRLPFAAYLRVSAGAVEREAEDRLRSPVWQLKDINVYGEREEIEIRAYEPELDVTGSKAARPILDQIIRDVQAGRLGGIVVANLDRLSRMKPKDRVLMFEAIEDAGGEVLSAAQSLDISTPEGRFAREVFLGVARMQWEKYAEGFARARRDAILNGAKVGSTPFGYMRIKGSRLAPSPVESPILKEFWRRAIIVAEELRSCGTTTGFPDLVDYLRDAAPTRAHDSNRQRGKKQKKKGDPRNWTHRSVRLILANRVYLGEVRYGAEGGAEFLAAFDAHTPLVTPGEFLAVQEIALGGTGVKKRQPKASYPLSGVLLCKGCADTMIGSMSGAATSRRRVYRCGRDGSRKDQRLGRRLTCDRKAYINADGLERYLTDWLKEEYPRRRMALPDDGGQEELAELERELAEAEEAQVTFASDLKARRMMGEKEWYATLGAHSAELERLRAEVLEAAQNAASRMVVEPDWNSLTSGELAGLLGRLGCEVVIRKGGRGVREIAPRVAIALQDDEAPPVMATA